MFIQNDLLNFSGNKILLLVRLVLTNAVFAYCMKLVLSRDRKEGDIKIVMFIAALSDYVLSHRPDTTLTLATAVVLISPQELYCLFAPFTAVVFFDSELGSHLYNPFFITAVVGYSLLARGFLKGTTSLLSKGEIHNEKLSIWSSYFTGASIVAIASILTSELLASRFIVLPVYYAATVCLVCYVYYRSPVKLDK